MTDTQYLVLSVFHRVLSPASRDFCDDGSRADPERVGRAKAGAGITGRLELTGMRERRFAMQGTRLLRFGHLRFAHFLRVDDIPHLRLTP